MNKFLFIVLFTIVLLLCASQVRGQLGLSNVWIYGTVTSEPDSVQFGISIYTFDFNMTDGGGEVPIIPEGGMNLTCGSLSKPVNGLSYNFSGYFIADNTSSLPMGYFFALSENPITNGNGTENNNQTLSNQTNWIADFENIMAAAGSVGHYVIMFVANFVGLSGIAVPQSYIAFGILIVCGLADWIFKKWYIRLIASLILLCVGCYLAEMVLGSLGSIIGSIRLP